MNVYQITNKNINSVNIPEAITFDGLLVDTNLSCNLHCIYCHNARNTNLISEDEFIRFIDTKVKSVVNFQFGCAMEPTMDKRLGKFTDIVSKSIAKPTGHFRIQTNAILLKNHDPEIFNASGVNLYTISFDSMNEEIHKKLRGGSDVKKIIDNIKWIRGRCPNATINLVTTLNRLNAQGLSDVVQFAVDTGINGVEIRKMFYHPESTIIKHHDEMAKMLMTDVEFDFAIKPILENFSRRIRLHINDSRAMEEFKRTRKLQ